MGFGGSFGLVGPSGSAIADPANTSVVIVNNLEDIPAGTPAGTVVIRSAVTLPPDIPGVITPYYGASDLTVFTPPSGNYSSATMATPANTSVGDTLIAICANQLSSGTFTWTMPSGWTEVGHTSTGRHAVMAVCPIVNTAALAALAGTHAFTITGGGGSRMAGALFRLRGVDLSTPNLGASTTGTGTTSTLTVPSFTTAAAGGVIAFATSNNSDATGFPVATSTTGMTFLTSQYALATGTANTLIHIFFKQVTAETSHAGNDFTFTPVAGANIYGLQAAFKLG